MPPATTSKRLDINLPNLVPPDEVLFGRSAAMVPVRKRMEKISNTDVPILFCGHAGTGKELLARWVHNHSPYSSGQFVKVNCAAIPSALLESELFGYEQGAFTGARTCRPGRVELAHKGTLFLDEIGDLDISLQSKLLHFIQDGRFSRIGAEAEQVVETRIICATNKNLDTEIAAGRFRADLYYRVSVLQVRLPCLSERKEDMPVLAEYFRVLHQRQFAKECEPLGPGVLSHLESLKWPGNVRELSNCIARFVLIGQDAFLEQEPQQHGSSRLRNRMSGESIPLKSIAKEAIRETERRVILAALRTNQWNRRKTAQALNISYRALIYKIRDAGLGSRRSGVAQASSAR